MQWLHGIQTVMLGFPLEQVKTSQEFIFQIKHLWKDIGRRSRLGISIRLNRTENIHKIIHHIKINFQRVDKFRQFQLEGPTFRRNRLQNPVNRDIHFFRNLRRFQQGKRDIPP